MKSFCAWSHTDDLQGSHARWRSVLCSFTWQVILWLEPATPDAAQASSLVLVVLATASFVVSQGANSADAASAPAAFEEGVCMNCGASSKLSARLTAVSHDSAVSSAIRVSGRSRIDSGHSRVSTRSAGHGGGGGGGVCSVFGASPRVSKVLSYDNDHFLLSLPELSLPELEEVCVDSPRLDSHMDSPCQSQPAVASADLAMPPGNRCKACSM